MGNTEFVSVKTIDVVRRNSPFISIPNTTLAGMIIQGELMINSELFPAELKPNISKLLNELTLELINRN